MGGNTSAGIGLDVEVIVGAETKTDTTDEGGSYSVTFAGFGETVATTGDSISVVVSDGSGVRGTNEPNDTLSNLELGEGDAATVTRTHRDKYKHHLTPPRCCWYGLPQKW